MAATAVATRAARAFFSWAAPRGACCPGWLPWGCCPGPARCGSCSGLPPLGFLAHPSSPSPPRRGGSPMSCPTTPPARPPACCLGHVTRKHARIRTHARLVVWRGRRGGGRGKETLTGRQAGRQGKASMRVVCVVRASGLRVSCQMAWSPPLRSNALALGVGRQLPAQNKQARLRVPAGTKGTLQTLQLQEKVGRRGRHFDSSKHVTNVMLRAW